MSQPEMLATPDGWQAARGYSQLVEGFFHRAFPSEGEDPVLEVLKIVVSKGGLRTVAPATFSTGADGLDPEVAGRRDGERTRAVLAAAGSVDLVATT
jgi:hypothetical protein